MELHGSGLDGQRQRSLSGLSDLLLLNGIAVLLPQGAIRLQLLPGSEPGFAWNVPDAALPGTAQLAPPVDDFGWIEDVVSTTRSDLGLTGQPLFLAGYSGGARLASHLLVKGRLRWTAAGLVAGLRAVDDGDHAPPPTISFHGLADTVNPYSGGGDSRWDVSVETACDRYAAAYGELADYRDEAVSGGQRRVYSRPGQPDALITYALSGAAHAWPGSPDPQHLKMFGPGSDRVNASELIAAFFMQQSTGKQALGAVIRN